MPGTIGLRWAASSETGRVRQNNEDSAYAGRWLYAVADGMGGHAAGEVASAAVIESLRSHDDEVAPDRLLEVLGRAVAEANAEVARRADEDPGPEGHGHHAYGDALVRRSLRARPHRRLPRVPAPGGQLRQITEDHVMGKLVSNARGLAPVISRYLDGRPERSPDLGVRELRPGDRYLLCSDGLSPVVSAEAIRVVLASARRPRRGGPRARRPGRGCRRAGQHKRHRHRRTGRRSRAAACRARHARRRCRSSYELVPSVPPG